MASGAGGFASANAQGGDGGKGGAGGIGLSVNGSNITVVNAVDSRGGFGGNGGAGGNASATATNVTFSSGGSGGNGGAGGAGAVFAGSSVTLTATDTLAGGKGGAGGAVGSGMGGGIAGSGGAGGTGVSFGGANATFNSTALVAGGDGGASGGLGAGGAGSGGNGGNGGVGVVFGGSGATLVNSGLIQGGNGTPGGNGLLSNGTSGAGGAGVVFAGTGTITNTASGLIEGGNGASSAAGDRSGASAIIGSGLTIANSGTIAGGFDGLALARATAIDFTGGINFLGGNGTINGGIRLDAGSLMPALPGSAIGTTLTVAGLVTFAPGSTYAIRVNGAANDSITGGFTTISGANVSAMVTGTPGTVLGKHTIITAGAISGTFASVVTNSAFLTAALSYDPTHVFLNFTGNGANGGIDFTPVAQNGNQSNVAAGLNAGGNANGFSGPLIAFIAGLSASQARAAFTALDGEVATGAERASFRFMDQFLNLMLDPFVDGHLGNVAGGVSGFAPERQAELPPEIAQAYASVLKAPPPATFAQRWSQWGAAFGGSGKTSGDAAVGSSDTTLSTYGFAGGIDYRLSPDTIIGFAAAGGGTNWGLANALGTGRSDAAQVGAYSRTQIGAGYIADSVAFANHWFSTNRSALGDTLRANFTGDSVGARLESCYRFAVMPNFGITPYAAAQAQVFHSGAYSETDLNNAGFGLAYASKTASDVRTELGARFDNPTLLGGTPLIIHARLAWAHDFVDTPSLSAAFQTLPLSSFTVLGAPIPQNSGLASVGADWFITRDWKLTTKFDGEFASRSNIYAGSVALHHSW